MQIKPERKLTHKCPILIANNNALDNHIVYIVRTYIFIICHIVSKRCAL